MVRELVKSADPKMEKALEHLAEELNTLRTGRATTALVDQLQVEYYGTMQPLRNMATITTPDARTIAITPYDRGSVAVVEKAIRESPTLGLNPNNDGQTIRLNIPSLTEERRKEIVKSLGQKVEECRIALRNIRHDVLNDVKKAEKAGDATQDDAKFAENELNKKIDAFQKRIQEVEAAKTKEIMSV